MHRRLLTSIAIGLLVSADCLAATTTDRSAVQLQFQKSVALAAGRYALILEKIESGKVEEGKRDLDHWVDLSILELAALEETNPEGRWAEVPTGPESGITMRVHYRHLAQYRKSHPRVHVIPLEASELQRIDVFVQKYQ